MKQLFGSHVRIGYRFYEILSILMISAGIEFLTSAIDESSRQKFLIGVLLTLGGILLYFSAARISHHYNVARLRKAQFEEKSLSELAYGSFSDNRNVVKIIESGLLIIALGAIATACIALYSVATKPVNKLVTEKQLAACQQTSEVLLQRLKILDEEERIKTNSEKIQQQLEAQNELISKLEKILKTRK